MSSMNFTRRMIGVFGLLLASAWASPADAQLVAGMTWLRADAEGKGVVLTLEACCEGGLRFVWLIPAVGTHPAMTMTVDSAMNGTEAPALVSGKPTAQTMAIKRVDNYHYVATVKMNGQPFGTSNGSVSADSTTMTVVSFFGVGNQTRKTVESWVRK